MMDESYAIREVALSKAIEVANANKAGDGPWILELAKRFETYLKGEAAS